jgi:hypothetical protein
MLLFSSSKWHREASLSHRRILDPLRADPSAPLSLANLDTLGRRLRELACLARLSRICVMMPRRPNTSGLSRSKGSDWRTVFLANIVVAGRLSPSSDSRESRADGKVE